VPMHGLQGFGAFQGRGHFPLAHFHFADGRPQSTNRADQTLDDSLRGVFSSCMPLIICAI